mmetsp:Transcript_32882/g.32102  ORF Transcript_32882/g.32102 Transcript_32882/m.32102 type:complete len:150 (-) Transcript_32882:7-456(-)
MNEWVGRGHRVGVVGERIDSVSWGVSVRKLLVLRRRMIRMIVRVLTNLTISFFLHVHLRLELRSTVFGIFRVPYSDSFVGHGEPEPTSVAHGVLSMLLCLIVHKGYLLFVLVFGKSNLHKAVEAGKYSFKLIFFDVLRNIADIETHDHY